MLLCRAGEEMILEQYVPEPAYSVNIPFHSIPFHERGQDRTGPDPSASRHVQRARRLSCSYLVWTAQDMHRFAEGLACLTACRSALAPGLSLISVAGFACSGRGRGSAGTGIGHLNVHTGTRGCGFQGLRTLRVFLVFQVFLVFLVFLIFLFRQPAMLVAGSRWERIPSHHYQITGPSLSDSCLLSVR
jgi:hypothetical protein